MISIADIVRNILIRIYEKLRISQQSLYCGLTPLNELHYKEQKTWGIVLLDHKLEPPKWGIAFSVESSLTSFKHLNYFLKIIALFLKDELSVLTNLVDLPNSVNMGVVCND